MPTLPEVLARFPDGQFLLDQKAARSELDTRTLGRLLASYPSADQARVTYWGDVDQYEILRQLAPDVRFLLDRRPIRGCVLRYLAVGWMGVFPHPCTAGDLVLPHGYASFLWGWPHRFIGRARKDNVRVYVAWVNDQATLSKVMDSPVDGILTDRVEVLGPLVRAASSAQ